MKLLRLRLFVSGGLERLPALPKRSNSNMLLTRCFSIMARYREENPTSQNEVDRPEPFRPYWKEPHPSKSLRSSQAKPKHLKINSLLRPRDPHIFADHPELVEEQRDGKEAVASNQKSLTVSLLGMPNAGKSSLLNALVKAPVAAVSKKINTTKQPIEGILTVGDTQIIFKDLPGIAAPLTKKLPLELVHTAWENVLESDLILLIVDAKLRLNQTMLNMISRIVKAAPPVASDVHSGTTLENLPSDQCRKLQADASSTLEVERAPSLLKQPVALVFNKMDKVRNKKHYSDFLIRASQIVRTNSFVDVFYLSAKPKHCSNETDDGGDDITDYDGNHEEVERLKQYLASQALARQWKYPAVLKTPMSYARLAQEHIRSYLFNHVHQELPYKLLVQIAGCEELNTNQKAPLLRIFVEIFATNDIAAKAVIGVSGNNVKQLTTIVPPIIEEAFRANGLVRRVQLQVEVIVLKGKDVLPKDDDV